ncbi:MAG: catalase, partial [Gemmatimonadaceae bacterium]|nr:catalase [Acetobacteraceae bacterium]
PKAGDLTLTDDEVKAKPPNFYAEELATRLRTGPAAFDLVATILQPGDVTNDSTVATPDGRKEATLGAIAIAEIIDNGICDAGTFDPVMVPEGMAGPADDPLFEIRSLAYAISLSRRQ